MIQRAVIATANQGKLREIKQLLDGWDIVPQSAFNRQQVEETGLSFVENAILKARHACRHSGLPAIADDSGLEVDALNGQPGIYSARYAGVAASARQNLEKLLINLASQTNRTARFRCVIVYMQHQHDPAPIICNGSWEGEIAHAAAGQNGFGYDPVFYVAEAAKTAAQLHPKQKNQLSHRAMALQQLQRVLLSN